MILKFKKKKTNIGLFFRNIFLGETFSCYISVHNDSVHTCKDILVKVGEL